VLTYDSIPSSLCIPPTRREVRRPPLRKQEVRLRSPPALFRKQEVRLRSPSALLRTPPVGPRNPEGRPGRGRDCQLAAGPGGEHRRAADGVRPLRGSAEVRLRARFGSSRNAPAPARFGTASKSRQLRDRPGQAGPAIRRRRCRARGTGRAAEQARPFPSPQNPLTLASRMEPERRMVFALKGRCENSPAASALGPGMRHTLQSPEGTTELLRQSSLRDLAVFCGGVDLGLTPRAPGVRWATLTWSLRDADVPAGV